MKQKPWVTKVIAQNKQKVNIEPSHVIQSWKRQNKRFCKNLAHSDIKWAVLLVEQTRHPTGEIGQHHMVKKQTILPKWETNLMKGQGLSFCKVLPLTS